MNRGARKLAGIIDAGMALTVVAGKVGVHESAVRWWRDGKKIPRLDARKIMHKEFGIEASDWLFDVDSEHANSAPSVVESKPERQGELNNASILEAQVRRMLELASDASLPFDARLKVERELQSATKALARAKGEDEDMPESKLIRTPAFRRVAQIMLEMIGERDPELLRDIALRLKKLDEEGR